MPSYGQRPASTTPPPRQGFKRSTGPVAPASADEPGGDSNQPEEVDSPTDSAVTASALTNAEQEIEDGMDGIPTEEPAPTPSKAAPARQVPAPTPAATTGRPLLVIENGQITHVDDTVHVVNLDEVPSDPHAVIDTLTALKSAADTPARDDVAQRLLAQVTATAW